MTLMKTIPLTQGKFALVDDEDFLWLSHWKWQYDGHGYAVRRFGNSRLKNTTKIIFMHRMINKTPSNSITDHINRNKLDNRKENLRNASKRLNSINRGLQKNNTSGVRGVIWNRNKNKWMAQIVSLGKNYYLGLYTSFEDAVCARKHAENKMFESSYCKGGV